MKRYYDLEQGEPKLRSLAKTKDWSMHEFTKFMIGSMQSLIIGFESDVGDEGKTSSNKPIKMAYLIKDEGAIGADLSAFKLPFFVAKI